MRHALKGISVFLLIFAAYFGYVYESTSDVRQLSHRFVGHIGAGEIDLAYNMLHRNLQSRLSLPQFTRQITSSHVNTLTSVYWTGFAVKNGVETARGAITLASGVQANVKVEAAKLERDPAYSIIFYRFTSVGSEDEL